MEIGSGIRTDVERASERFRFLTEKTVSAKDSPERWNRKEILGHLIDSAMNNLQRIVRAQFTPELRFPGYAQVEWVAVQQYASEEWSELLDLWISINRHLARVIDQVPVSALQTMCRIGESQPMTLDAIITDYLRHMEQHLRQIDPEF